jgi:hypothetical protein
MPNSAERSDPITASIMLILLFVGFGLLVWVLKHEAETHRPPGQQTISKPVNK